MFEALSILSVVKIYMMAIILICDVWYASVLDLVAVLEATFISFVCTPCKHPLKTGVIRICKSKDRQHNDRKKKDKRTNNDL